MLSRKQLAKTRTMAVEFQQLLAEGDRADVATIIRITEVSGWLSTAVPHLLDEIERLRAGSPAEAHIVKLDARGGTA